MESKFMVAQLNPEMFSGGSYTPPPEPTDSDGVLLALETARALEEQGEMREVARWLRRAADEAAKDGNDERVLVLARAAADLAEAITCATTSDTAPRPAQTDIAPALATLMSPVPPFSARPFSRPAPAESASMPATIPPSDWFEPTIPPPATLPAIAGPISSIKELARPAKTNFAEHAKSIGAIPVAIPDSLQNSSTFVVQRLDGGQPLPTGTVEAVLVLTNEIEGILELVAARLREVKHAMKKR
jgi:hypothetical protein